MSLKAISPFIASVLLIGFTIAAGVIVYYFVTTLPKVQTQQVSSLSEQVISCAGGFFDINTLPVGIYRKAITIDNTANPNNLNDYQVLITNPIYNETGLVLSLHFNEGSGTIAYDSSGNNNHGNLVNGPTWVDGKFGKALSFDGVDDYVDIPNNPNGNYSRTFVAWVKNVPNSGRYEVINSRGIFFNIQNGKACIYILGASSSYLCSSNSLNSNQWNFIAGVYEYEINTVKVYVNGLFSGSLALPRYPDTHLRNDVIGWCSYCCPLCAMFNGTIDEVRIYNRALSDAEIQALYQAKARLDYGDIRFTDSDGSTLLNYWQEADGKFWVKVPNIPASSTKTIYVYYGNPNATSLSNGDNTFDFFDDFLGNALDTNKWQIINSGSGTYSLSGGEITIASGGDWWGTSDTSLYIISTASFSYNYIAETRVTGNSYNNHQRMFGLRASSTTNSRMFVFLVDGDASHITHVFRDSDGASAGWYGENTGVPRPSFPFILKFVRVGDTVYGYVNDNLANSRIVANWGLNYVALTDTHGTTRTNKFDWIRVRKYTSPEPTTSVGNEESATINKVINLYGIIYNATISLLSSGSPLASMGNQFTAIIYLTNGTMIQKDFSLDNNCNLGKDCPLGKSTISLNSNVPIDKIRVCSKACNLICNEIKVS